MRCAQLTVDNRCAIFGQPERPPVCRTLKPSPSMCGVDAAAALRMLTLLERATTPS